MKNKSNYGEDDDGFNYMDYESEERVNGHVNGYRLREIDLSQVPEHLLKSLSQVKPYDGGVLAPDEVQPEQGAWIIQCPKDVKLRSLLEGKKIRVNGIPTILNEEDIIDEQNGISTVNPVYECISSIQEEPTENMCLLLPNLDGHFKIVSTPLNGYITIRQHIEEVPAPEIKCKRKKQRKLPSGIKERHPIYGVDFSHALSSDKVTRSPRKQIVIKTSYTRSSEEIGFVKLKRGKSTTYDEPISSTHWEQSNIPPSSPNKYTKSKLKHYQELTDAEAMAASIKRSKSQVEIPIQPAQTTPRKSKKSKVHEEVVFQEEIVARIKRSKSVPRELPVFATPEPSPTAKKSKKRKREESEEEETTPVKLKKAKKIKQEPLDGFEETPQKLKKSKKSKS